MNISWVLANLLLVNICSQIGCQHHKIQCTHSMRDPSIKVKFSPQFNTRLNSSPSPFDQVSHRILKRCPSLATALLDIFQCCWSAGVVPRCWKAACIRLIGKPTSTENPDQPSNFRPIALTACIGKVFTAILKNRWLKYMLANGYLDRSIQKAFMNKTSGCIEHHAKLAAILRDARSKHKSLAVCWLDLANAYGSVHHSLIDFSLARYYAPPTFSGLVRSLYQGLSASFMTREWSTPSIPLKTGVSVLEIHSL